MGSVFLCSLYMINISRSLFLAASYNFVLNLQSSETLMVENLTDVSLVEVEMRIAEVDEGHDGNENDEVWILSTSLSIERIITNFVTVREIVNVMFFLPGVTVGVACELVLMAIVRKGVRTASLE